MLPDQRSDGTFSIPDELRAVFTFARIDVGIVPTADRLLNWIKDVFRHVFNNFDPGRPDHADVEARGMTAIEYLSAYLHALLVRDKATISAGRPVPDTMLTRLLRLQRQVAAEGEDRLRAQLGPGLPTGQAAARLSDSMIRSNVLGTVVGGVVNPQEATCRIVDSLLRLRAGEYPVRHGSDYATAVRAARTEPGAPGYRESLGTVRGYALEALRLHPQGDVLLRTCVQDTELGGVRVPAGALVFVGYAGAMRDPAAVPEPLAFDVTRDQHPFGYLCDGDRAREEPQSRLYLQHGFARHKCLGPVRIGDHAVRICARSAPARASRTARRARTGRGSAVPPPFARRPRLSLRRGCSRSGAGSGRSRSGCGRRRRPGPGPPTGPG